MAGTKHTIRCRVRTPEIGPPRRVLLNKDLWYQIFAHLQKDWLNASRFERLSHFALPVLLVCKEWKEIATPLLYSSLVFESVSFLHNFARCIQSRRLSGRPAATYIQHLRFDFDQVNERDPLSNALAQRDMMAILAPLRQLKFVEHLQGGFQELSLLSAICGTTLEKLQFEQLDNDDLGASLRALHDFRNLHILSFHLRQTSEDGGEDEDELEEAPFLRLSMPHLRFLQLTFEPVLDDFVGFYGYFRNAHIPKLQTLYVTDLSRCPFDEFFENNGANLSTIGVDDLDNIALPAAVLPALRHVTCCDSPFSVHHPNYKLSATVRHLHIRLKLPFQVLLPYGLFEGIWQLLDFVRGNHTLRFIHLENEEFSWQAMYEQEDPTSPKWVKYALRLEKEFNITLLDVKGQPWTLSTPIFDD